MILDVILVMTNNLFQWRNDLIYRQNNSWKKKVSHVSYLFFRLKNLIQVGWMKASSLPFFPQFKIIFSETYIIKFVWWLLKSTHLEKNTFWFAKLSVAFSCTFIVWQWSTAFQFCCLALLLQLVSWLKIASISQETKLKTENMIVGKVF